ncbi:MAG: DUF5678 domain-containing protein [Anaerolineae bacterium]|jgi:hypothetical protein
MVMAKVDQELVLNEDILAGHRWIAEHRAKLQRYEGLWIAVSDEQVVAFGEDPDEVETLAQQKTGKSEYQIPLVYIENTACIYGEISK